jgi:hypothetical protein
MNTDYTDIRFVYARRSLNEPEIWRRPATLAFSIEHMNAIVADETESTEKRAYAEKLWKQLCMAGKQPKVPYRSTTAKE